MDISPIDFTTIIFQSSLALAALLFGVFGFLYSVYASFAPEIERLPVVKSIRIICRIISVLITTNAVAVGGSVLLLLNCIHGFNAIMAVLLGLIGISTSIISIYLAVCHLN